LQQVEDLVDENWWQEACIIADRLNRNPTPLPAAGSALCAHAEVQPLPLTEANNAKPLPTTEAVVEKLLLPTEVVMENLAASFPKEEPVLSSNVKALPSITLANLSGSSAFGGALISIGPNTDAMFDRFGFPDKLLPRLRVLTTTICSSKWEAVLRSRQWGLTYEQVANLSKAMVADIKNEPMVPVKVCITVLAHTSYTFIHEDRQQLLFLGSFYYFLACVIDGGGDYVVCILNWPRFLSFTK
jgi:hypothetical protein